MAIKNCRIINFFLFSFLSYSGFSQKPEYLHLVPQNNQTANSIFSNIEVVDTRFDTVYMGFVQKGAFNRKAPFQLGQSMNAEVQQFANACIAGASKQDGTVLVNIRSFFISEAEKATAETGTFVFKAGCYFKNNYSYDLMFTVDTSVTLRSMWDVTKKLEEEASKQLGNIIKRAAGFDTIQLQKTSYLYTDIEDIDDLEKKSIPVYNVLLPQKGLYINYEAFKNNQPTDTNFIAEIHSVKNIPVFYSVKDGYTKGKPIKTKNYYAICDGEQLYISTNYGIYPAIKNTMISIL
ncbi:hypothetical protein [Parafilimonas sp.]|uniref:hypothetical protein n=1 Tax=Parafilimonas sp. TaxID=1969739 RepID=UPI003F80B524